MEALPAREPKMQPARTIATFLSREREREREREKERESEQEIVIMPGRGLNRTVFFSLE